MAWVADDTVTVQYGRTARRVDFTPGLTVGDMRRKLMCSKPLLLSGGRKPLEDSTLVVPQGKYRIGK